MHDSGGSASDAAGEGLAGVLLADAANVAGNSILEKLEGLRVDLAHAISAEAKRLAVVLQEDNCRMLQRMESMREELARRIEETRSSVGAGGGCQPSSLPKARPPLGGGAAALLPRHSVGSCAAPRPKSSSLTVGAHRRSPRPVSERSAGDDMNLSTGTLAVSEGDVPNLGWACDSAALDVPLADQADDRSNVSMPLGRGNGEWECHSRNDYNMAHTAEDRRSFDQAHVPSPCFTFEVADHAQGKAGATGAAPSGSNMGLSAELVAAVSEQQRRAVSLHVPWDAYRQAHSLSPEFSTNATEIMRDERHSYVSNMSGRSKVMSVSALDERITNQLFEQHGLRGARRKEIKASVDDDAGSDVGPPRTSFSKQFNRAFRPMRMHKREEASSSSGAASSDMNGVVAHARPGEEARPALLPAGWKGSMPRSDAWRSAQPGSFAGITPQPAPATYPEAATPPRSASGATSMGEVATALPPSRPSTGAPPPPGDSPAVMLVLPQDVEHPGRVPASSPRSVDASDPCSAPSGSPSFTANGLGGQAAPPSVDQSMDDNSDGDDNPLGSPSRDIAPSRSFADIVGRFSGALVMHSTNDDDPERRWSRALSNSSAPFYSMNSLRIENEIRLMRQEAAQAVAFADDDPEITQSVVMYRRMTRAALAFGAIAPRSPGSFGRMYTRVVLAVEFALIVGVVWRAVQTSQNDTLFYCLTTLCCLLGSFVGLVSMQLRGVRGLLGPDETPLESYALVEGCISATYTICARRLAIVALAWFAASACQVALQLECLPPNDESRLFGGLSIMVSIVMCSVIYSMLHVFAGLQVAIDQYCVCLFDHQCISSGVVRWNLLQALLRRSAYTVEGALLSVCTGLLGVFVTSATRLVAFDQAPADVWFSTDRGCLGLAAGSVLPLCALAAYLVFSAAAITDKCNRVPSVVNSGDFGSIVMDTKRHYLVQYIVNSAAGFYIRGARLTAVWVFKLAYICGVLLFSFLTQSVLRYQKP